MEELRRGRERAQVAESGFRRDPSMHRTRAVRWPLSEIGAGLGREAFDEVLDLSVLHGVGRRVDHRPRSP
jgi:hypothetical protein